MATNAATVAGATHMLNAAEEAEVAEAAAGAAEEREFAEGDAEAIDASEHANLDEIPFNGLETPITYSGIFSSYTNCLGQ